MITNEAFLSIILFHALTAITRLKRYRVGGMDYSSFVIVLSLGT